MNIAQTKTLTSEQIQTLFQLWNSEYPEKVCFVEIAAFENYLDGLLNKRHYLLLDLDNRIIGWAFTFFRDNDVWFAIIVNTLYQGKGFGSLLLEALKKNTIVLNGWVSDQELEIKLNKEPYFSPLPFYIKNGFCVNNEKRLENEKISAVKISWKQK